MDKIIPLIDANLVTPKARAKHGLLFNKPASEAGLLNKISCLAQPLGVTKIITCQRYYLGHTLLCYLSQTYMFNKPTTGLLNI